MTNLDPHYDYAIVGAGSAGAALAARLTEDASVRVILLEAGPDYRAADAPLEMGVPNPQAIIDTEKFPQFQWPKLVARRTREQAPRLYWRGRGLGGSSAINGQIAIRGVPEDYDRWAAEGCRGWSAADVLPAFRRLEDDLDFGDRSYHGRGGPIPIYRAPLESWGAVDRALRDAGLDLGYVWADDHNAPGTSGVSTYAINSRDARRVSTNDGYLEPARERANLEIVGGALVDRVVFDGQRARGVELRKDGAAREVSADEVLLCAGAVHSPAILMRSGVGPPGVLEPLGIDVRGALPVGRNWQDHPLCLLGLALRPEAHAAHPHARHTNCCIRYSSGLAGAGANDMMIVSGNLNGLQPPFSGQGAIVVWVNQCFSRGELRITARDPEVDPEIDENLLSDPRDLERMRDGVRRLAELSSHARFSEIADGVYIDGQARTIDALASDDAIDAWVLASSGDAQHGVGSCRMGAPDDARTVVDPDCRVLGLEGLRVIDASIMPDVPRANTHLTAVMIGEHMAARLRGD